MDPSFWHERWQQGQIGFHRDDVHPDLLSHGGTFLDGATGVLVPLCGKSVDLPWLAQRVPTVGVELSPIAIEQLHDEARIVPNVTEHGDYRVWRSPNLTVLQGDVFDLAAEHIQGINRVWDRAALVALQPAQRARYVAHLRHILPRGTVVLLNAFAYDEGVMSGPPHNITEGEVRAHYQGCDLTVVEVRTELDEGFKARGHRWFKQMIYRIEL